MGTSETPFGVHFDLHLSLHLGYILGSISKNLGAFHVHETHR